MNNIKRLFVVFAGASVLFACSPKVDVLVVGGGTAGTAAGIQAARMGAKTMIAEEHQWLGGMLTSAGVSAVDGNFNIRSGIYDELVDSLGAYYGGIGRLQTGWVSNVLFEPHVGDAFFKKMAAGAGDLDIRYGTSFVSASKLGKGWKVRLAGADGEFSVKTAVLIDGTELGDAAKACGVDYRIGMDSREDTGESIAPEKANGVVQDLTYCMILKDYGPDADMTIEKPRGYNPALYYNSAINPLNRNVEIDADGRMLKSDTRQTVSSPDMMISYGRLPVKEGYGKYMINWPGDGNDIYVNIIDASPERRKEALDSAKNISLGFLYFMQTALGMKNLGIADDEFPTEDGFPFIPYHRESRRIVGKVLFTLDAAARPFEYKEPLYRTGIGSGNYPVDHHHCRYEDWQSLPKLDFYPIPSYCVPLGVIMPEKVEDLLVTDKSISVTNLINGSTRLQPVALQTGQAAGALAALAVKAGTPLSEVPVRTVQDALLAAGIYIMPYQDLDNSDPHFAAIQRIGATGILRGDGHPKGWANETWFRIGDILKAEEIFLEDYYPAAKSAMPASSGDLSVSQAISLLEALGASTSGISSRWTEFGLSSFESGRPITRLEFAVLLDNLADPFHKAGVDLHGNLIE